MAKATTALALVQAEAAAGQRRVLRRIGLSLALASLFLGLLWQRLQTLDLAEVATAFASVSPAQWGLALAATAVSFWAVAQYDVTLHRHLGSRVSPLRAGRAGAAAIAVSQTLGLGVVTGGLVRWRMLPELSLWQATQITLAVTASFLAGWAVVTACTLLLLPAAPFKAAALAVVLLALVLTVPGLLGLRLRWRDKAVALPNGFTLARVLGLTAVDTIAASLVLFALCPPDLALPFATLLPAFLLALGAGMVSGAPGGVGAFEVVLLALLPGGTEAPLLAAMLAFRGCYYALPALVGAALASLAPQRPRATARTSDPMTSVAAPMPHLAEFGLVHQGTLSLLPTPEGAVWLTGRTPHALVALRDPMLRAEAVAIATLKTQAKTEGRLPCLYKCGARSAAAARRLGFATLVVAREAHLDPRSFTTATPARAGLRRKLRRAQSAGLRLTSAAPNDALPQAAMAQVNAAWATAHGGERGFSMGRFCPRYLSRQWVVLAWLGCDLVGFASFHQGAQEWTLDLMRQTTAAPDGTMQALVAAAIAEAGRLGLPRLSLAAVPEATLKTHAILNRLLSPHGAGLAQFKHSFAPRWERLYLAAPSRPALLLCAAEIARAIHRPGPLRPGPSPRRDEFPAPQAEYEFAPAGAAWHSKAD
ncbi:phosphatidylglycerol lysyltransferase domain-containing protein [Rhodobacter ferrooxidans]|uniref:Phosphatidylglycerol lysyltransferase n=1 Tax=Rhodobacter ferrooxidans TaxID=371731 RepID=C8S4S7_9RHOB|nr:phosphatidylglycerol lysyltransferase domain-containing protein [Rhodobacter sp. SW2]EEW23986.1 protein of unknown function DUF471 [Rhodobacter sp. SW2]